jgi:drug/metabolite transporter (DMT)-like permease
MLALIWGSSFILMKHGLFASDGSRVLNSEDIAAVRMIVAALILLPTSIKAMGKVATGDHKYIAIVGFAGSAIPALCFATAQQKMDSGVAGMLNSLTPLFTFLIGVFVFRRKVEWLQLAGIALAMTGTLVLITSGHQASQLHGGYAMLLMLATFLYGMSVNTIAAKLQHVNALHITSISLLMAAIPYVFYVFMSDMNLRILQHPEGMHALGYIVLLGAMGTGAANFIYFRITQIAGPLYASSVTYLIPIVAYCWAIVDGESIGLMQVMSAVLILCGVALLRRGKIQVPKKK